MKNIKHYLFIIIISAGLTIFIGKSLASDGTITCSPTGCTGLSNALFNESNVAPGKTVIKTLKIKNNGADNLNINILGTKNSQSDDLFLKNINVRVGSRSENFYDSSLESFLSGQNFSLGKIPSNSEKEYEISLLLLSDSDNSYQNKSANFNISINANSEGQGETSSRQEVGPLDSNSSNGNSGNNTTVGSASISQVLGSATNSFTNKIQAFINGSHNPEVLGASCEVKYFNFWLPFLIGVLVTILAYRIYKIFKGIRTHH